MKAFIKKSLILILVLSLLVPSLASCATKDKEVVGYVGEYEVYYEELRYFTMQYKELMASAYGEDIWDNAETAEKYRKELEERVYSSIVANYTILTLCDDDLLKLGDVKLIDINSDEVQTIVDNYVNSTIDELGGRAEYNQNLKDNYLTDSLYRFINGVDVCENLLFNYYCNLSIVDDSDEAAIDYIYENFIRTVHIYIQNNSGDNVEDNRKLANALKVKLENGEDMNELIKKYSEDQYTATEDGRYFTRGQYSDEYEDAAFALEMNQISEVIETPSGFYIIQRLPMEDEYIGAHFLTELKDQYLLAAFDKAMDERKTELVFYANEFGASIDLVAMK